MFNVQYRDDFNVVHIVYGVNQFQVDFLKERFYTVMIFQEVK